MDDTRALKYAHIYFWILGIVFMSITEKIIFHWDHSGFWASPVRYEGLFGDAWHFLKQLSIFCFSNGIYFYRYPFPLTARGWREYFDWQTWLFRFMLPVHFFTWIVHQVVFHYT